MTFFLTSWLKNNYDSGSGGVGAGFEYTCNGSLPMQNPRTELMPNSKSPQLLLRHLFYTGI
jgi:hypothetical protein